MKRMTILIAAVIVAGCAKPAPPTPTPAVSPIPLASASLDATAAALRVEGTVRESCVSYGGCAYFAELSGLERPLKAEFAFGRGGDAIVVDTGLPATLPAGDYILTLSSYSLSDALVAGGGRPLGPVDATCSADFTVADGQASLSAHGSFDKGTCSVAITG